jgi:hypothetical protein
MIPITVLYDLQMILITGYMILYRGVSVVDPGCLSRIQIFFPSGISALESSNNKKEEGGKFEPVDKEFKYFKPKLCY